MDLLTLLLRTQWSVTGLGAAVARPLLLTAHLGLRCMLRWGKRPVMTNLLSRLLEAVQAGTTTNMQSDTWTMSGALHLYTLSVYSRTSAPWPELPGRPQLHWPHPMQSGDDRCQCLCLHLWLPRPARMHVPYVHLMGHPSTWLRPSVFPEVLRSGTT